MKNRIVSYNDLDVYQRSYKLSVIVCTKVLPKLPLQEKFDLKDQLGRACKAVPRLIAEGFGKKHQKKGFQRYLDDALGENNETTVCLCQIRDIYPGIINSKSIQRLIDEYEITGKQVFKLKQSWSKFS